MSTLTSIPISNPKRFLALQDQYKHELMSDQRLDEAAKVAARRQLLLENTKVDPYWAVPQVKAMGRRLNHLTKRIRQPYGATAPSTEEDEDDPADDFAAGPVQAMVKRFLKPSKPPTTIKKTPPNPPVRRPRVQHTPVVTPSPRRPKPPASPLTGFELVKYGDYQETPEDRVNRIWNETALSFSPTTSTPLSNRRASPQFALQSPPSVRRSPLPRTPILYEPFPSSGVSYDRPALPAPTFDYPLVAQAEYDQQQAAKGVKRKRSSKRVPSEVRQHVKRLSNTPVARRTRQAVKKKAKQTAKTKAKEAVASQGTKYLKSWLKFK